METFTPRSPHPGTHQEAKLLDDDDVTEELQDDPSEAKTLDKNQYFAKRVEEAVTTLPHDPERLSRWFGGDTGKAGVAIEQAAQRKPISRVATALSSETLGILLSGDGKLKSLFETGQTTGGKRTNPDIYLQIREKAERETGLQKEGEPPIIYGYLEDLDTLIERTPASSYGPVTLIFKSEVSQRSTFTQADSLTNVHNQYFNFDDAVIAKQLIDLKKQSRTERYLQGFYTEAQILGGVDLDDVEVISLTSPGSYSEDMEETVELVDKITRQLPEVSVLVRVPAKETLYTKHLLKLAQKYPKVHFAITIDAPSLFIASNSPAETRDIAIARDYPLYKRAVERKEHLEKRIVERWEEEGSTDPLPSNISLHIANPRY